jgi:predicted small secreted protein
LCKVVGYPDGERKSFMQRGIYGVVVSVALLLSACATMKPDEGAGSRIRVVYVASSRAPCPAGTMKGDCFQIRERPDQPWELWYAPIDNFDYRPGTEYLLKVTETQIAHPPADTSAVRWHVDKIVEQHAVP